MYQNERDKQKTRGKITAQKEACDFALINNNLSVFSPIQIDVANNINLIESLQTPFEKPFEKRWPHKKENDGLNVIVLLVGLLHVLLFFCIDRLWQQNVDNRRPKSIAAMKSYLYVSPEPKSNTPLSLGVKMIPPQMDEPKSMAHRKMTSESRKVKSALKAESQPVTQQQDVVLDLKKRVEKSLPEKTQPEKASSEKSLLVSQAGLNKQVNLKSTVETPMKEATHLNESNASFRFDETDPFTLLNSDINTSNSNQINNGSFDGLLDEETLSYLKQEHASKVSKFAKEQALSTAETATLSDMTPQPNALSLPQVAPSVTDLPQVHGQLMDPSRIVQKGDFCYPMIKTPTQINPHAEIVSTIGYRCSPDEDKQNVQNLINQR
ncbi:hypothetical protein [uncultured Shewanella sp.]|uniref:hypothetical protein n=1 Tax=uncultured Shewanella sp. TaxID=173975 RepID=UPI002621C8B8|nr:hypothetical protein [uncultured Shewanella sp.]